MAKLGISFNTNNVEPAQAMDALPPAWYTAKLVESDVVENNAKTGTILNTEFEVIAPAKFAGRKFWERYNLTNPSEQAVEIAQRDLAALCLAVGFVGDLDDTQVLHETPIDVKLGLSKITDEYPDPQNVVKGYRPCTDSGATQGANATKPKPSTKPAAKKPPVKKAPPAKKADPVYKHTSDDYSEQELADADYSQQEMVDGGYGEWAQPEVKKAPPKKAPPKKTPPPKQEAESEEAESEEEEGDDDVPPWQK